jgi:Kef-type K+ transport system membrane component KefB
VVLLRIDYCRGNFGKLFGCAFTLRARGLSWRESLTVGTLVNTRGLIEFVILNIGSDRKIISPTLFSMMVLMALATTFMTGPLLSIVNPVAPASVQR